MVLGQNKNKKVCFPLRAHLLFCDILTHLHFFILIFSKNENRIAYIEIKLEKKIKDFPENVVLFFGYDQFQQIWALKYTNMSFCIWNIGKYGNIKIFTLVSEKM